ncbi:MAG: DUF1823 family protein [Gemmatimonadaceae bacterium]|nr:DUF1823 family protein [Gloeobacterales cyanobacterium ES-bin-141]
MNELPPLDTATLRDILEERVPNATVNRLLWHCLGYRPNSLGNGWDSTRVPEEWQQYPEPPDFIDSRPAIVKLTRSIPAEHKQLLKEVLAFEGYRVSELTPHRTRRATAVNWLLSFLRRTAGER